MRWGIFSDIHGNLEALDAILAALTKERIDRYLCLGDLVGYGADPNLCIAEIKAINPLTIAGNHDWAAVGLFDSAYFNPDARAAVLWASRNITEEDKQFLKSLQLIHQQEQLTSVHGSLEHPENFGYILDIFSAEKTFELLRTRVCFIGHTHRPVIFIKDGQTCKSSFQAETKLEVSRNYIINVGSVGQPRDGNPQAAYVIYDSEKEQVQIKRASYDVQKAQAKIIKAGLPRMLAERLALGR